MWAWVFHKNEYWHASLSNLVRKLIFGGCCIVTTTCLDSAWILHGFWHGYSFSYPRTSWLNWWFSVCALPRLSFPCAFCVTYTDNSNVLCSLLVLTWRTHTHTHVLRGKVQLAGLNQKNQGTMPPSITLCVQTVFGSSKMMLWGQGQPVSSVFLLSLSLSFYVYTVCWTRIGV